MLCPDIFRKVEMAANINRNEIARSRRMPIRCQRSRMIFKLPLERKNPNRNAKEALKNSLASDNSKLKRRQKMTIIIGLSKIAWCAVSSIGLGRVSLMATAPLADDPGLDGEACLSATLEEIVIDTLS